MASTAACGGDVVVDDRGTGSGGSGASSGSGSGNNGNSGASSPDGSSSGPQPECSSCIDACNRSTTATPRPSTASRRAAMAPCPPIWQCICAANGCNYDSCVQQSSGGSAAPAAGSSGSSAAPPGLRRVCGERAAVAVPRRDAAVLGTAELHGSGAVPWSSSAACVQSYDQQFPGSSDAAYLLLSCATCSDCFDVCSSSAAQLCVFDD
ncbi:MAG: hypothetical protein WKG00_36475 [Polyangiaceae bacterium]